MPKKDYKFTITLVRELTEDEHFNLEFALAVQCESIVMATGNGGTEMVDIGYIIGSERLEAK